eukprot:1363123-Amphidinium_carterae.1
MARQRSPDSELTAGVRQWSIFFLRVACVSSQQRLVWRPFVVYQGNVLVLKGCERTVQGLCQLSKRSQQTNSPPVLPTSQSQTDSKPTATAAPSVPAFLTSLEQALEDSAIAVS